MKNVNMRCVNSIQVKCIEKFRDKNNTIVGYRLADINGKTIDVKPDTLKNFIRTGQINVVNLTLTSDNRLLSCETKQSELVNMYKDTIKQSAKQHVNEINRNAIKAKSSDYIAEFIAYILQNLHRAGISDSGVIDGEEIIDTKEKYIDIEKYIMLDKQYNDRDIAVTVMFTNRQVWIDICYAESTVEIDKTPRLRDKIDWKTINDSNKIIVDKLASCIKAL
jgi:hypothetical protein